MNWWNFLDGISFHSWIVFFFFFWGGEHGRKERIKANDSYDSQIQTKKLTLIPIGSSKQTVQFHIFVCLFFFIVFFCTSSQSCCFLGGRLCWNHLVLCSFFCLSICLGLFIWITSSGMFTLYGGVLSWARVSCEKIWLLSSRSESRSH